jgi:uncharacterized protein DUF6510
MDDVHGNGDPVPIDGNALGGLLGTFLGLDLTSAQVICTTCDREQIVAQLVVYAAGPGSVARCRGCSEVVVRAAVIRDDLVLDLRGTRTLRISQQGERD